MKIKLILLSIFFASIAQLTIAQKKLEWAKQFEGISNNRGTSIAVDALGNVYTTGNFSGTVDFDPDTGVFNLSSVAQSNIYISKLDTSGNFVWAKCFVGGAFHFFSTSITTDLSGNIYVTGLFNDTVDFDPGPGVFNLISEGNGSIFICKLDAFGNFAWAKNIGGMGGTGGGVGYSITTDIFDYVYITGVFQGTVDFDPGSGVFNLSSIGNEDIFISKLEASGNFVWAKHMEGADFDHGISITVDDSGYVYTTGGFEMTVDFDPGPGVFNLTSTGMGDIFISKLDASGNFVWAKSMGGSKNDYVRSICLDGLNNVYTTGYYGSTYSNSSLSGTADFDPGPGVYNLSTNGGFDVFVSKLDASGNFVWAKSIGGTGFDHGQSITSDTSGNVYIIGRFNNTADFDPSSGVFNLSTNGGFDVFIVKLDASGNFVWVKQIGGSGNDFGSSITTDVIGNVYSTGFFHDTADFDPTVGVFNLSSVGGTDIFVHKMSPCVNNTGTDMQTACNTFTWIDGITYTASNNTAKHTLINATGCDSVVTLDLTIINSPNGTDVQTACNTFTWINGITYTASNNAATYSIPNGAANGCDSTVILNLTINNVSDITTSTAGITISANNSAATYQWLDCNNNYALISGETNQSFTPLANGSYAVELTENGCVDTSACVNITTVGMIENSLNREITIYPNPTNGQLTIVSDNEFSNATLTVRNSVGQIVFQRSYSSSNQIDLTLEGAAGVYFLEIVEEEKRAILKVVKE